MPADWFQAPLANTHFDGLFSMAPLAAASTALAAANVLPPVVGEWSWSLPAISAPFTAHGFAGAVAAAGGTAASPTSLAATASPLTNPAVNPSSSASAEIAPTSGKNSGPEVQLALRADTPDHVQWLITDTQVINGSGPGSEFDLDGGIVAFGPNARVSIGDYYSPGGDMYYGSPPGLRFEYVHGSRNMPLGAWGGGQIGVWGPVPGSTSPSYVPGAFFTANSAFAVDTNTVILVGGDASALGSKITLGNYRYVSLLGAVQVGAYGVFQVGNSPQFSSSYFDGNNPETLVIGLANAPVTLSADGPGAGLYLFNEGLSPHSGTTAFFGNAAATAGGRISIQGRGSELLTFPGNAAGTMGNLTATGFSLDSAGNRVGSRIDLGLYSSQVYTPQQTFTASNYGNLWFYGATDFYGHPVDPVGSTLVLNAKLNISANSSISFGYYRDILIGSDPGAQLLVNAGALGFYGMGTGSIFTYGGASPLGVTNAGAIVYVGAKSLFSPYYSWAGYEQVAFNGGTIQATGGGQFTVLGYTTPNSLLSIAPGTTVTVGGSATATQSKMVMENFLTVDIQTNLLVGQQGLVDIGGFNYAAYGDQAATNLTVGNLAAPVVLSATGTNAALNLNATGVSASGTSATVVANLSALQGGSVSISGGGTTTLFFPSDTSGLNGYGNITANGGSVSLRGFQDINLLPSQNVTLNNSGVLNLGGSGTVRPPSSNTHTNTLEFNPNLIMDGSNVRIAASNFKTVRAGDDPAVGSLVMANGSSMEFYGTGQAGSSFTAGGVGTLGATGGGYIQIGISGYTDLGFETVVLTGSHPLVDTGGSIVGIYGISSAASSLTITPGAFLQLGGDAPASAANFTIAGFETINIQESLLAGSYVFAGIEGAFVQNVTPTSTVNIGTLGHLANLTANGEQSSLTIIAPNLNFYGDATATAGGWLQISPFSGQAGNAVFTGSLRADGMNQAGDANSALSYYGYKNPTFGATQSIQATNGGYIQISGLGTDPGSPAPNGIDIAHSTLTVGGGGAGVLSASGPGSLIYFSNFNQIVVSRPVNADNGGTVIFDMVFNTALSLTTSGDPTGNCA